VGELESIAKISVDCGYNLHKDLGPGLLESAYEILLAESLKQRGLDVARQVQVPIEYKGVLIDNAFRVDLVIEGKLLSELKSIEKHAAVHAKQLLTYLRLMWLPLGFLMNFGMTTFKDGVCRMANDFYREGP
jgi:GxxExxY protein